jgi:HSF-type DNA-binding
LNFYSFRKIKYADTIKIDTKLEEETANYWRFRHENFRRGKPELLTEIKRMNGQKGTTTPISKDVTSEVQPTEIVKSNTEVQILKEKIEEMTKNIDQLTQIVQRVSLKQEEHEKVVDEKFQHLPDLKRKKGDSGEGSDARPDVMTSAMSPRPEDIFQLESSNNVTIPDDMLSSMAMDLDDLVLSSSPLPETAMTPVMSRETSSTSEVTDAEFVDQLFTAFNSGDDDDDLSFPMDASLMNTDPVMMHPITNTQEINNKPDPELMKKLGDALMLLPREIQEMIVDRLIAAITNTDGLQTSVKERPSCVSETKSTGVSVITEDKEDLITDHVEDHLSSQMPLAAATFAALLRHYTQQGHGKCSKDLPKSIPVIPVHA